MRQLSVDLVLPVRIRIAGCHKKMKQDTLFLMWLCPSGLTLNKWSVCITIQLQFTYQVVFELIHCDDNFPFEAVVIRHT